MWHRGINCKKIQYRLKRGKRNLQTISTATISSLNTISCSCLLTLCSIIYLKKHPKTGKKAESQVSSFNIVFHPQHREEQETGKPRTLLALTTSTISETSEHSSSLLWTPQILPGNNKVGHKLNRGLSCCNKEPPQDRSY